MDTSITHLRFINDHCNKTSIYLDKKTINKIQVFCLGLLERLSNSSNAIAILLEQIQVNPSLEYACGIILRSSLLDALIVFNLYQKMTENEDGLRTYTEKEQILNKFCESIFSDGLENTIRYLKEAKNLNLLTQGILQESYVNLVKGKEFLFEPYNNLGSEPIVKEKKPFSPTSLFKNIAISPKLKELSKIYDSYLFFSKYDHFGIIYYEVRKYEFVNKLRLIRQSIEILMLSHAILHLILRSFSDNDSYLNDQSNIAAKYLSDNIPDSSPIY